MDIKILEYIDFLKTIPHENIQWLINQYEIALKMFNENTYKELENYYKNFFVSNGYTNINTFEFVKKFNDIILNCHIYAKLNNLFFPVSSLDYPNDSVCINCKAKKDKFIEGIHICEKCGLLSRIHGAVAWGDVCRIHSGPSYSYDRRLQFKEHLLQYEGKCGENVDFSILERFNKLTPPSKMAFYNILKTINKTKSLKLNHVHALYYKYTGISPPVLTAIEPNLLADFDKFIKLTGGKITVSNQFLTYQFLNRYGYETSKDDVLLEESFTNYGDLLINIFNSLKWKIY